MFYPIRLRNQQGFLHFNKRIQIYDENSLILKSFDLQAIEAFKPSNSGRYSIQLNNQRTLQFESGHSQGINAILMNQKPTPLQFQAQIEMRHINVMITEQYTVLGNVKISGANISTFEQFDMCIKIYDKQQKSVTVVCSDDCKLCLQHFCLFNILNFDLVVQKPADIEAEYGVQRTNRGGKSNGRTTSLPPRPKPLSPLSTLEQILQKQYKDFYQTKPAAQLQLSARQDTQTSTTSGQQTILLNDIFCPGEIDFQVLNPECLDQHSVLYEQPSGMPSSGIPYAQGKESRFQLDLHSDSPSVFLQSTSASSVENFGFRRVNFGTWQANGDPCNGQCGSFPVRESSQVQSPGQSLGQSLKPSDLARERQSISAIDARSASPFSQNSRYVSEQLTKPHLVQQRVGVGLYSPCFVQINQNWPDEIYISDNASMHTPNMIMVERFAFSMRLQDGPEGRDDPSPQPSALQSGSRDEPNFSFYDPLGKLHLFKCDEQYGRQLEMYFQCIQ